MTPHYEDNLVTVYAGDCLDVLRELPDSSVDSVVTDPPYGLGFMGKEWDTYGGPARGMTDEQRQKQREGDAWYAANYGSYASGVPAKPRVGEMVAFQQWCELWTAECLRVLKPGGHLLAFGGTRTWHRLACAVEDAGFEVRDSIAWLYGSGFPKSLDVSKAIDKAAGAEREVVGPGVFAARRPASRRVGDGGSPEGEAALHFGDGHDITAPATDDARQWQGWGTALKPAFEPIVVARKPLSGTVAANVLAHGTGALNIDGCRVSAAAGDYAHPGNDLDAGGSAFGFGKTGRQVEPHAAGRWPANVVLDDSQAAELDRQSGTLTSGGGDKRSTDGRDAGVYGSGMFTASDRRPERVVASDTGGASRFFPTFRYQAKAPTRERPTGDDGTKHPTVKPLALMQWLVRLVTPRGGVVLEPFAGSGTTVEAALREGFRCIAIERQPEYLPLIQQRIDRVLAEPPPVEPLPTLFDLDEDGAA